MRIILKSNDMDTILSSTINGFSNYLKYKTRYGNCAFGDRVEALAVHNSWKLK